MFIAAEGDENTVGVEEAGSDTEAGGPSPEDRDDAQLAGRVVVSVDIEDDSLADEIRSAFAEFDASEIEESCPEHDHEHLLMVINSHFVRPKTTQQAATHRTQQATQRRVSLFPMVDRESCYPLTV